MSKSVWMAVVLLLMSGTVQGQQSVSAGKVVGVFKPQREAVVAAYAKWLAAGGLGEEQAKQTAEAQRREQIAEEAARKWVAQYVVGSGIAARSVDGKVALLVLEAEGDDAAGRLVSSELVSIYETLGYRIISGIFRPAFFEQGLAQRLRQGDVELLEKLGIAGKVDRLVMAKLSFSPSRPSQFDGIVAIDGSLSLTIRDGQGRTIGQSQPSIAGAGGTVARAKQQTAKRLMEQLSAERTKW